MITLDQIRTLDSKVQQAVEEIESLREENSRLRDKLSAYEKKVSELEVLIDGFRNDQGEIEEGIQKALLRLDVLSSQSAEAAPANNAPKPTESAVREQSDALEEISKDESEELQAEELDIF